MPRWTPANWRRERPPRSVVVLPGRAARAGRAGGDLKLDQIQVTVKVHKAGKKKSEPGGRREIKFDDGARIVVNLPPRYDAGPAAVAEMLRRGLKKVQAELKQSGPGQAA
jgi:hypothetical protein